jgi:hypothetical protein
MSNRKTGSGKELRTTGLSETALPIPYSAPAMPGATVLGTDGLVYRSIKVSGVYTWSRTVPTLDSGEIFLGIDAPRNNFLTGLINGGFNFTPSIQIEGNDDDGASLAITRVANGADAVSRVILSRARGAAPGSNTIVQLGDSIASILFNGADGAELMPGAAISTFVDNTPGTLDVPMEIRLRTRAQGSGPVGISARMRISSDGNVSINNTTGTEQLSVTGNIQVTEPTNGFLVGVNPVVGARRTGWAAPTGTAERSTYATYSAPTFGGTPTTPQLQAVANHVQTLSRRLKAVIDDLTAHGLIGS